MDAPDKKPDTQEAGHTPVATPLIVVVAGAWLAFVLAVGLWQGYGRWWFLERGGHVA